MDRSPAKRRTDRILCAVYAVFSVALAISAVIDLAGAKWRNLGVDLVILAILVPAVIVLWRRENGERATRGPRPTKEYRRLPPLE